MPETESGPVPPTGSTAVSPTVPLTAANVLLGVGASALEVARWAARPVLATARSVTRVLAPPDWITEVLAERGVRARAELEQAALDLLHRVLVRIDLTTLVQEYVDLDAVAAGLDLDALIARADLDGVIGRLDLAKLVQDVLDAVDLPAIVRESSETVASEALAGVRTQAMQADDAVTRLVDRMLRRRLNGARGTP